MTTAACEANVLIVDDVTFIRKSLNKTLTDGGFHCTEAGTGEEAMRVLNTYPADLVILDVLMPGISGSELLPRIKERYPDVAVVMATSVEDPDTIISCMKNGASDYISKPIKLNEVPDIIRTALLKQGLQTKIKHHMKSLQNRVTDQSREIRKLTLGSFEAVINALEAKDKYTAGHSRRVSKYAEAIGRQLGLQAQDLDDLIWGAILHDVGKIAIDPLIQNKPSGLTEEEYRHIMTHVHIGPSIVKPVANQQIMDIIAHHHDFYDGEKPNQKVKGNEIPLGARIVAVADTFDAMTSHRPYRAALPSEVAAREIRRCSGTQFDPSIVEAFFKAAVDKMQVR